MPPDGVLVEDHPGPLRNLHLEARTLACPNVSKTIHLTERGFDLFG